MVTVTVFYGSRAGCKDMAPFLSERLQPCTLVVSVQFEFPWCDVFPLVYRHSHCYGSLAYVLPSPQCIARFDLAPNGQSVEGATANC